MPIEDLVFLRRLYTVQPFGYRRDEFNTGLVCSTILNSQRANRNAKVWSPMDAACMPFTHVKYDVNEAAVNRSNLLVLKSLVRNRNALHIQD